MLHSAPAFSPDAFASPVLVPDTRRASSPSASAAQAAGENAGALCSIGGAGLRKLTVVYNVDTQEERGVKSRAPAPAAFAALRVSLTGTVAVHAPGAVLDAPRLGGRQARLLLALLVVERDRPLHREEIAERLWGERPPDSWASARRGPRRGRGGGGGGGPGAPARGGLRPADAGPHRCRKPRRGAAGL